MAFGRSLRILVLAGACLCICATTALAQPTLMQVKLTADGYELAGKGFGRDKAKVQVFEGFNQVAPGAIVSVADNLIIVRSKPSGMVQHRVVVGGQASTIGFMHSATQFGGMAKPAPGPAKIPPGLAAARVMVRPPAVPSLTQTLTTTQASMTGNRGQVAASAPSPVPSLTQNLTTAQASMTGNRGQAAAAAPPVPSLTQTLTTPAASMTGNR